MKNIYALLFATMLVSFSSYALKPKKEYIITPDSLGMKYKELRLTTADNYKINTWVMRPNKKKDNKTVMILAYGDAMNMSYWVEQCYYFVQDGFTVISFDYRGFGHSSPFELDSNQLYYNEFAFDLERVLTYAKKDFKGYRIGVRALSMGTMVTTIAYNRTPFDYFIGDSFLCDPIAMQERLKKQTGRNFGLPAGAERFSKQLDSVKCPLLFFAGDKDENSLSGNCNVMVPWHRERKLISYNGGHMEGIYVLAGTSFGAVYIKDIKDFLKIN